MGDRIKIEEGFAHPTKLNLQHFLHLLIAQPIGACLRPICHLPHNIESLLIASEEVDINQSLIDFVERVPRRPHLYTRFDTRNELFGIRAQVSIAKLFLTFR